MAHVPPFSTQTFTNRRLALGLSLAELERQTGIGGSQLSAYERGRAQPRPAVVKRLAEALGLDPLDLYEQARRAG